MAQPQSQTQPATSTSSGSRGMPATRSQPRGGSLVSRDPRAWAASPFGLMRRLSDDMDELFGQLIGGAGTSRAGAVAAPLPFVADAPVDWVPALETFERDGKLVVQADLPGLEADDVTVEIDDGVLNLSGERREEREVDDNGIRRTERRYGRFTRSVALPEGARTEEVQASFCNGVLEITIPLAQSSPQRRTVQIQSASGDTAKSEGANGGRQSASGSSGSGS
jgi:HSP20 family protein